MTEREFLDRLERCLASLDAGERAAMVDFYSEQIEDRIDDGMTEAQAVASLESPEDIAANILAQRAESQSQAQDQSQSQASAGAASSTAPGAGAQSPAKPKGCLHMAGKVLLWICAAIGILLLLPVACGVACAVVSLYLCLWVVDLCLGIVALACVFVGALSIVACMVSPATGMLATVANVAVIAGFFWMAVLMAIATYFFGKLLVMLVVWSVRAVRGRAGRTRDAAPVSPKEYPSMPMPPMDGGGTGTAGSAGEKPRRRMPLWGVAAIGSTVVVLASAFTVLGTIGAAGGPEELAEQAGSSLRGEAHGFDASTVDRIEVGNAPYGNGSDQGRHFYHVYLGVSSDNQIHVVEPNGETAMMFWGSVADVDARQVGSTVDVTVDAHDELVFANPVASFGAMAGDPYRTRLRIYVPQGWKGAIAVNSATAQVEAMPLIMGSQELAIDGNLELRANSIDLVGVSANAAELTAETIGLQAVSIKEELQVNQGQARGWAWLSKVDAKRGAFGGEQVHVTDCEIGTVEANVGTTVDEARDDELPGERDEWKERGESTVERA